MSNEHTFVTPGPAGLGALAVACFGFGAVFTGKVTLGGLPLLAAWLIGGGVVQYTVAVMELKDHNMTGGNVFLFFAAFFMFGAALSVLAKYLMLSGIIGNVKPESMVEGFCWMAGASFLTAVTPAYTKSPLPLFVLVLLLDVALWLIVGLDMGVLSASLKPVVGYILYAAGWVGIYLVAAIVNNHIFGRMVLPTFGTILK
jgi:succinate-acetate transporter protein